MVKRFRFRLEKVLQIRVRTRDMRAGELATANSLVQRIEGDIESTRERQLTNEVSSQVASGASIILCDLFGRRLEREIVALLNDLEEAKELANIALSRYLEASKEVKALEALRDRRRAEYEELVLKKEQDALDELSTLRGNTIDHGEVGI